MDLTGNDLTGIFTQALRDVLVQATEQERQEYQQWAEEMSPIVTQYALLAASGDPKAAEILGHVKAQAEAKLWIIANDTNVALNSSIGNLAGTAATFAGTVLSKLVANYGLVLLGLV